MDAMPSLSGQRWLKDASPCQTVCWKVVGVPRNYC
jgi:hypothetical protein